MTTFNNCAADSYVLSPGMRMISHSEPWTMEFVGCPWNFAKSSVKTMGHRLLVMKCLK